MDIWSAGVILYVMLVGNTPWDEPTMNSPEFSIFASNPSLNFEPWCNLPPDALGETLKKMEFVLWCPDSDLSHSALIRNMLSINPTARFTIEQIKQSAWYRRHNPIMSNGRTNVDSLMQKLNDANIEDSLEESPPMAYSQPDMILDAHDSGNERGIPSFSQPAFRHHVDDMLTQPTQFGGTLVGLTLEGSQE